MACASGTGIATCGDAANNYVGGAVKEEDEEERDR